MEKQKDEFTVVEIAEIYGVSKSAVYKWLRDGMEHRRKKEIGKNPTTYITKKAVEEYHDSKT